MNPTRTPVLNLRSKMLEKEVEIITDQLKKWNDEGKKLFITSSFQSHSLPLLHIAIHAIPHLPVLFIDTGFHFPETYQFRDQIVNDWGLNLINLKSNISKHQQKAEDGRFLYNSNPNYCCHINKVEPLDQEVVKYDIWIAGLRRDQTKFRAGLESTEMQPNGVLKYHPILEWNSKMIYEYQKQYDLPRHPLEEKGYFTIGCMPCTRSVLSNTDRGGRWLGSNKTECGIHLKKIT